MLLNLQELFSDDQDLAKTAATYASTNILDLGEKDTVVGGSSAIPADIGPGEPIDILIKVTETFTSGGAATLVVKLEVDDNTGISSAANIYTSPALALATLAQGYELPIHYIPNGANERYMRVTYTIGTATTTAGKITAGLVAGVQTRM